MTREELRSIRKAAGQSQPAFAKKLKVAANTVARWEQGKLPIPAWVELRYAQATIEEQRKTIAAQRREIAELEERVNELGSRVRSRGLPTGSVEALVARVDKVFRQLVNAHHPDRSPDDARIMAAVNAIWNAVKGK